MFKPLMLSLTALTLSFAQSASAAEHTIVMEEGAFYPEITYLAPGDQVTFTNKNTDSVEAIAADGSWTTGQLSANASFVLDISTDTALAFAFASDASKAGSLSFDFAPLGDVDGSEIADDGLTPEASN